MEQVVSKNHGKDARIPRFLGNHKCEVIIGSKFLMSGFPLGAQLRERSFKVNARTRPNRGAIQVGF